MKLRRTAAVIKAALFLLGFLFIIIGCGGRNTEIRSTQADEYRTIDELVFNVDQNLLGPPESIPEIAIEFQVPDGWTEVDDVPEQDLPIEVIQLFVGSGPSYLLIGMFPGSSDPSDVVSELFSSDGDEKTTFLHNRIEFHQIRRITDQNIVFSLVFAPEFSSENEPGVAMFQYVLPVSGIEARARLVESSIGSISSIDSNR